MTRPVWTAEVEALRERLRFAERMLGPARGVLAFDRDGRYFYWNDAMEDITGLAAAEVLGRQSAELFPFLRQTGQDSAHARALAGEVVVTTDRPYLIPQTGRQGIYEAHYSPLEDAKGHVIGVAATLRDTTEAHQARGRLHETEARFKNMADAAPVLLWMSGTDSLCTFFNQTWLDFTGRTLEEEWGVGWAEGVHFEDFQRCIDTYEEAFCARRPFEMEYRLRRKDGEYRWILDRGTPRYGLEGRFAGFIGSCVDITEMKHLEAELRKAVHDRDDFLSIASHELRTPLTTLHLQVESLLRAVRDRASDPLSSGRLEKSALSARKQTEMLARLIEELLDVSRIASGRLVLALADVDLSLLLEDLCERLGPSLSMAECPLSCSIEPDVRGRWDAERLDRAFVNILSNAMKYGRGKPIDVVVAQNGHHARVLVRDRGIGIAPADHARIFERFERAVSASNYGGFGLGLWIAREVVEAHQGSICVASELDAGTEFVVELPIAPRAHAGGEWQGK